jgi:hypothetical protein
LLRFGGGGGAESTLEELDEPLKKLSSPISEWEGIGRRLLVGGGGGGSRSGAWWPEEAGKVVAVGAAPGGGVSSNEVTKVGSWWVWASLRFHHFWTLKHPSQQCFVELKCACYVDQDASEVVIFVFCVCFTCWTETRATTILQQIPILAVTPKGVPWLLHCGSCELGW